MKLTVSNVIAAIGFLLLFVVFAAGAVFVILFTVPNISIFGMVAVNERNTEIVYKDTDLVSAFQRGNFIIESNYADIEIIMQRTDQAAKGAVVINESANGVAFNNFARTLVEWTDTIVDGVPYFKIKVLEPYGMVIYKKPTKVYINLEKAADYQTKLYNFILDNGNSKVNFSFGDTVQNPENQLHINNLVIKSAKSVSLPAYTTMDVNNVYVNSNSTNLSCGALVKGNVEVNGSKGSLSFNKINGTTYIEGNKNSFIADATGDIKYSNLSGELKVYECNKLDIVTSSAYVSIGDANGKVTMLTDSGNLNVGAILSGGLDFTATTTANVEVNKLKGNAIVRNNGNGRVKLYGVDGNVDIDSSKKDASTVTVKFETSGEPSVKILGYDGNITVTGIRGHADIRVRDPGAAGAAGKANITAEFCKIQAAESVIVAGAYVNSDSSIGKIVVYLMDGWNNFNLNVELARSAWSYPNNKDPFELKNGQTEIRGGASLSFIGKLRVSTPSIFELR